jgi:hypothetical protein
MVLWAAAEAESGIGHLNVMVVTRVDDIYRSTVMSRTTLRNKKIIYRGY